MEFYKMLGKYIIYSYETSPFYVLLALSLVCSTANAPVEKSRILLVRLKITAYYMYVQQGRYSFLKSF